MTPLTLGRAIAWAAIFDADPDRLPHWADWSRDLREWADEHATRGETPSQDTNNEAESGTMEATNKRGSSRVLGGPQPEPLTPTKEGL